MSKTGFPLRVLDTVLTLFKSVKKDLNVAWFLKFLPILTKIVKNDQNPDLGFFVKKFKNRQFLTFFKNQATFGKNQKKGEKTVKNTLFCCFLPMKAGRLKKWVKNRPKMAIFRLFPVLTHGFSNFGVKCQKWPFLGLFWT